jgi:hypothetical protein
MEIKVCDEQRPCIEILEFHGGPGYDEERLMLENGLSNGLRFLIVDGEDENVFLAHFHIHDPETARTIAKRLLEWSDRIANPPAVP